MRPGDWVAAGLVAAALGIDVVLIRRSHDPISTCVRRSRTAKAITLCLAAHLVATVPGDPLTALGRRLTR